MPTLRLNLASDFTFEFNDWPSKAINNCYALDELTLMEFDVFLSHNSNDKPAVREMKGLLMANSLQVWLDEDELQPGIPGSACLK